MSRWKLWRERDGFRPLEDVMAALTARVECVAWVVPPSTGVRECRVVSIELERDGTVNVSHAVTVAPDGGDDGAIYPEQVSRVTLPGWVDREDWEADGDE